MTRTTNARIAGIAFLLYIGAGLAGVVFLDSSPKAEGIAAKLAGMAEHTSMVHIEVLLSMLTCFTALTLAVTLFGITRDEDRDLAAMMLVCRGIEASLGVISLFGTLGLLWLGTNTGPDAPDTAAAHAVALFIQKIQGWNFSIAATFFAVGSTIFSYLLIRGRLVPSWLAWLGLIASVLIVMILPLQLIDIVKGTASMIVWLPMLVFEVTIAFWFIIVGIGTRDPKSQVAN